jgi:hydroxypyruvate isomerase
MERREFLKAGMLALGGVCISRGGRAQPWSRPASQRRFGLDYAPHFGMFKHSAGADLIDQLKFAAAQGFTAWEDAGLADRPVVVQQEIARATDALSLRRGALTAAAAFREVTFCRKNRSAWERVLTDVHRSVEVARRVGAKWLTVVPGKYVAGPAWKHQAAICAEWLKRCCAIVEPHGLVLVLQPVSRWPGGPDRLVQTTAQAYQICRTVASPSCKLLFDIYHHETTVGHTLASLDRVWSETAYIRFGDNPGRREPGTGSIDCRQVFQHLYARGYDGIVGMEHGNSRPGAAGELAVIEAYAKSDPAATPVGKTLVEMA